MSFQAMTWAVEQELPAMQKIVLLMMANRTSNDNGLCFPSHEKLAKDCGMEKRSVIRQIEKLETAGLLTVIRSVDDKGMKAVNKYRLHLDVKASPMCHKVTTVVTESHQGSDTKSLGGSDTKSHKTVNSFNQSINQSVKQENAPAKKWDWKTDFDFTFALAYLISKKRVNSESTIDGINMALWFDWMEVRKDKKVANTQTAMNGQLQILIEIENAGMDANAAMADAIKNNWTGLGHYIEKMKPKRTAGIVKPDFTNQIKYSLDDDFGDVNAIDSFVVPTMQFAQIGGRL